jgi:hypothetical protein
MLMNTVGEKLSLKCSLLLNGSTVGLLNGHERYDRLSNKPVSALDFDDLTNEVHKQMLPHRQKNQIITTINRA